MSLRLLIGVLFHKNRGKSDIPPIFRFLSFFVQALQPHCFPRPRVHGGVRDDRTEGHSEAHADLASGGPAEEGWLLFVCLSLNFIRAGVLTTCSFFRWVPACLCADKRRLQDRRAVDAEVQHQVRLCCARGGAAEEGGSLKKTSSGGPRHDVRSSARCTDYSPPGADEMGFLLQVWFDLKPRS